MRRAPPTSFVVSCHVLDRSVSARTFSTMRLMRFFRQELRGCNGFNRGHLGQRSIVGAHQTAPQRTPDPISAPQLLWRVPGDISPKCLDKAAKRAGLRRLVAAAVASAHGLTAAIRAISGCARADKTLPAERSKCESVNGPVSPAYRPSKVRGRRMRRSEPQITHTPSYIRVHGARRGISPNFLRMVPLWFPDKAKGPKIFWAHHISY